MADDQKEPESSEVDDQSDFSKIMQDVLPKQVVTNWIVVAETMTEHGPDIHVQTSDAMTTWLATGMLQFASEVVLNSGYAEYEVETDE